MRSYYPHVHFREGVAVGVAYSERVMAGFSVSGRKRKAVELEVSEIEESCDGATVHGVVVELSPVKADRKDSAKKCFTGKLSDGEKNVRLVSFDPSSCAVFDKSCVNSSAVGVENSNQAGNASR